MNLLPIGIIDAATPHLAVPSEQVAKRCDRATMAIVEVCFCDSIRFIGMSNAIEMEHLRPIERRVLEMQREGVGVAEIASRIKRSPEFVERMISWTEIPRNGNTTDRHLTPIQQRVLDLRATGETREEIASRFKKGEAYIRQVEGLAHFKESQRLLTRS